MLGVRRRAEDAIVGRRNPACRISSLAKTLLPSSSAASLRGPKIRKPSRWKMSTIPLARGSSGPTTVSPMPSRLANWTQSPVIARLDRHILGVERGARVARAHRRPTSRAGDRFSFQQSACSRPPLPITRTFNDTGPHPQESNNGNGANRLRAAGSLFYKRGAAGGQLTIVRNSDQASRLSPSVVPAFFQRT